MFGGVMTPVSRGWYVKAAHIDGCFGDLQTLNVTPENAVFASNVPHLPSSLTLN